jgi:hypothetical protein
MENAGFFVQPVYGARGVQGSAWAFLTLKNTVYCEQCCDEHQCTGVAVESWLTVPWVDVQEWYVK